MSGSVAVVEEQSSQVSRWYASKTRDVLAKYGPGPRVHYHTGWVEGLPSSDSPSDELRKVLVAGQERLLAEASRTWQADQRLCGEVLDVGCGLGGGALYWAENFGARVTAVTNVPLHATIVERFASAAGQQRRVRTLVADACNLPENGPFDAVVAVESSCYLGRREWFAHLATLVRPGGHVFIMDAFADEPSFRVQFDTNWNTRIGSLDEYARAADAAGFRVLSIVDCTAETANFWRVSMAHARAKMGADTLNSAALEALRGTFARHWRVLNAWERRWLLYLQIAFVKS